MTPRDGVEPTLADLARLVEEKNRLVRENYRLAALVADLEARLARAALGGRPQPTREVTP